MSLVNAIIIKNRKIMFKREHYNKIIKAINNPKPRQFLDAGYIIVDFDSKTIINAQNAFSTKDISSKQIKNMAILNL